MHYTFMFGVIVFTIVFGSIMLAWAGRDARRQKSVVSGTKSHMHYVQLIMPLGDDKRGRDTTSKIVSSTATVVYKEGRSRTPTLH